MNRHNFDRGDRGGLANLELGELYYPLERMVMSHSTLSQEYSTSCDISVAGVPSNFTNVGGFTWSSSNSNVCTVVKTGQFTATINFVSQGICTVSCDHIEAGTSLINCTALPIRLTSFDLSTTSLSQEYSTKAIVSVGVFRPVAFTNVGGFIWQSSNSAVCNVSKINNTEAEINFIAQGNATITVKHPDLPAKTIACTSVAGSFTLNVTLWSQSAGGPGGPTSRWWYGEMENVLPTGISTSDARWYWQRSITDDGTSTSSVISVDQTGDDQKLYLECTWHGHTETYGVKHV